MAKLSLITTTWRGSCQDIKYRIYDKSKTQDRFPTFHHENEPSELAVQYSHSPDSFEDPIYTFLKNVIIPTTNISENTGRNGSRGWSQNGTVILVFYKKNQVINNYINKMNIFLMYRKVNTNKTNATL